MDDSAEGGRWSLVESDPAVFGELIRGFGASGVEVDELWSLAPECFERQEPIHGFVFLFKWRGAGGAGTKEPPPAAVPVPVRDEDVFFARQVTENACATQAVVNLLMNVRHEHLELGTPLTELREFCKSFDARSKGLAIANSAVIRQAHNSFARRSPFESDGRATSPAEDAYHFVAFAPVKGRLLELDGLEETPLDHGPVPEGSSWVDLFRTVVRRRIDAYGEGEIRFNLMAVVSDRQALYGRRLRELDALPRTEETDAERVRLRQLLEEERHKRRRDRAEIARRRHDYLAFIVELLKILAKEGKLMALYRRAEERSRRPKARRP